MLRILVVDDTDSSRLDLCRLVRELGHEVYEASSGMAALEQALAQTPDVVLLDLLMPDMNGFEVTQRLHTMVTQRWLPVIVTSSLQGEQHFIEALHQGADDFLARPINPEMLEAKLRHYGKVLGLQSRLAAMAQRQRAIHDNILDAVITLNGAGVIEESNLAATGIFGIGAEHLLGQRCEAVIGANLTDLLAQRELSLVRADGTRFPAEVANSEWSESGRVRHTIVIRDLTERQRVDRMKDEFLATVSHELRTPLSSVLGALSLLAAGAAGALPEAAKPLAEMATRNGERLGRLIDDILDLTKLEGNQLLMHVKPSDLTPLLREALNANQGYAQRAEVKLCGDFSESGPQVQIDADRFLQAMANLLSNAIKHSAPGDTVRVSIEESATHVRVKVRDQGPGIAPEFRAHMFEKFSQADGSDRRAQGGTGLGLYITRMLVERMGGSVEVDSVAGVGATFILVFPIAGAVTTNSEPRVLHIDCDFDARKRVADWLSPMCAVTTLADLQQAQEQSPHLMPTLILADPQAQGSAEAFCSELKRIGQGCSILLYSDSVDANFAQRMGFEWLQKSGVGQQTMQDAVRSALVRSNQRKQS